MSESVSRETSTEGETNDDLIALAAEHGYSVSKRNLAEWHRAGLLPRPVQRPHVGTSPGSDSVYPPGTSQRLLAVCRCRERYPHNMQRVAWCLWWEGGDAPMQHVRGLLARVAGQWSEQLRAFVKGGTSKPGKVPAQRRLSRKAVEIIDRADSVRIAHPVLRSARKRTNSMNFPTLVRVMFEVAVGAFSGFSMSSPETAAEDREIVEKGLGLSRARTDHISDVGPWLSGNIDQPLQQMGPMLQHYPPGFDLDTARDEELVHLRDEVRTFVHFVEDYADFLGRAYGRGAFGLTVFGWLLRRLLPEDQGFLLLIWRSLRAYGLGENLDQILRTAHQWNTILAPIMRALEDMAGTFPETGHLLSSRQMGRALRSKQVMDQTLRQLHVLRTIHTAEFDAYFAQRPEMLRALDAAEAQGLGDQTAEQTGSADAPEGNHEG